jgi:hypothetical protein
MIVEQCRGAACQGLWIRCRTVLPQPKQRMRMRGWPDAVKRSPPMSQTLLWWPHDVQSVIQERDSWIADARQLCGITLRIRLRSIGTASPFFFFDRFARCRCACLRYGRRSIHVLVTVRWRLNQRIKSLRKRQEYRNDATGTSPTWQGAGGREDGRGMPQTIIKPLCGAFVIVRFICRSHSIQNDCQSDLIAINVYQLQ